MISNIFMQRQGNHGTCNVSNMLRPSQNAGKVPKLSGISTMILLNKLKQNMKKSLQFACTIKVLLYIQILYMSSSMDYGLTLNTQFPIITHLLFRVLFKALCFLTRKGICQVWRWRRLWCEWTELLGTAWWTSNSATTWPPSIISTHVCLTSF